MNGSTCPKQIGVYTGTQLLAAGVTVQNIVVFWAISMNAVCDFKQCVRSLSLRQDIFHYRAGDLQSFQLVGAMCSLLQEEVKHPRSCFEHCGAVLYISCTCCFALHIPIFGHWRTNPTSQFLKIEFAQQPSFCPLVTIPFFFLDLSGQLQHAP